MKEQHLSKTPFLTFAYLSKCNTRLPCIFGNSKKIFLCTGLNWPHYPNQWQLGTSAICCATKQAALKSLILRPCVATKQPLPSWKRETACFSFSFESLNLVIDPKSWFNPWCSIPHHNALWFKSNGSYVIKDFGALPLICWHPNISDGNFNLVHHFFSHPNIPDKWKRDQRRRRRRRKWK